MSKDKKMSEEEFILGQIKRNKVIFNICSIVFIIVIVGMVAMVLLVAISKSETKFSAMEIVVFVVMLLLLPYMRKLKKNCNTAINEMSTATKDESLARPEDYSKETKQARKTVCRSVKQIVVSAI